MGQQSKNIDNLFKDELGSYAETPPPMAWDALEKRLDKIPPKGAVFNPGKALYMVMITSLLLLSISVARKMYIDHMASVSTGIQTDIPGKQLNNNRPVSEAVGVQTSGKTNTETVLNKPDNNLANNNITENTTTKVNSNPLHKNNTPIYKKLSNVTALKNTQNTTDNKLKNQDIGANNTDGIAANISVKDFNAAKSSNAGNEPPAENTNKETGKDIPKPGPAPDKPKNADKPNNKLNTKIKPSKPRFVRFEAGIKAGYETGFNITAANKLAVSPYIQFNLTPKVAIMVQPAIKKGTLQTGNIGTPQSYYKENNDSSIGVATKDPYPVHIPYVGDYSKWYFRYSQTYDSIVKSYSFGGKYTEYELPILIKYNIAHGISVYGGVNLVYNKYIKIVENTYSGTQSKNDSSHFVLQPIEITTPPAAEFSVNQVLKYTGTDISNYKYPFQPTPSSSFRVGYMIGFSYEYQKRWLLDGLMQQTPTSANVQGGYNINSALSSTYFRFTLGYKLIK